MILSKSEKPNAIKFLQELSELLKKYDYCITAYGKDNISEFIHSEGINIEKNTGNMQILVDQNIIFMEINPKNLSELIKKIKEEV